MSDALVARKERFAAELEAGRAYAWCPCGRRRKPPSCDGSRPGTSLSPVAFKAERDVTAYLCGCRTAGDRPFCDGSHNQL